MTETLSEAFAQRLIDFRGSTDDPQALEAARIAIIDTLAVTLLGAGSDAAAIARRSLLDAPDSLADDSALPCQLYGTTNRATVLDAAMLNGVASHADDFDDFTDIFGGHPSVPILPAIQALGEAQHSSALDVMRAYLAGVEMENRLANGVHFHHYEKGWHPTSTLGVFGAAAACAHLLDLDADKTAMALAIAASFSSGIKANFGSMTKPLHVGHCARSGLQAAKLAAAGFTASLDVFENPQGFLNVYNGAGNYNTEIMLSDWFSPGIAVTPGASIKQFPCCGSTHPAIYMALRIREQDDFNIDAIQRIDVRVTPKRLPHTNNANPETGLQAKFSVQYVVARALATGPLMLAHFDEGACNDPLTRSLMSKIHVEPDDSLGLGVSDNAFGADVTVSLLDDSQGERVLHERTEHLPGRGREYPITPPELAVKFNDCARQTLTPEQTDHLFGLVEHLSDIADFATVAHATRTTTRATIPLDLNAKASMTG